MIDEWHEPRIKVNVPQNRSSLLSSQLFSESQLNETKMIEEISINEKKIQ